MITIRELTYQPPHYNKFTSHPLQSWEWGDFRQKTGIRVFRFEELSDNKLINVYQLTLHKLPKIPFYIGYLPKSHLPSGEFISYLIGFSKKEKVIFIKFEPNVKTIQNSEFRIQNNNLIIGKYELPESPRPLFTKYTFQINLTLDEKELLAKMKPKTRYNMRLAEKKGVKFYEDNSDKSFDEYLKLQQITTKRQKFYAHNEKYHRLLWKSLKSTGIAHILNASYQEKILVSWMVFLFNDILYYPYGGSADEHRNLMPSNLMLWEAIKWGKTRGAKIFDLWGALGLNPDPKDPWYGFHKFKEGYGGELVEFIGSYDLVINPYLYYFYNIMDNFRWMLLQLKL